MRIGMATVTPPSFERNIIASPGNSTVVSLMPVHPRRCSPFFGLRCVPHPAPGSRCHWGANAPASRWATRRCALPATARGGAAPAERVAPTRCRFGTRPRPPAFRSCLGWLRHHAWQSRARPASPFPARAKCRATALPRLLQSHRRAEHPHTRCTVAFLGIARGQVVAVQTYTARLGGGGVIAPPVGGADQALEK